MAKPNSDYCKAGLISFFMKKTKLAPSIVPKRGMSNPIAVLIIVGLPLGLLFQFQAVLEGLTNALRDLIIAVRVRVESDGLQGFDVDFAVLHLVGFDRGLQHLADDAKPRVVALVFNELALHGDRQLVDDGSVHQ